MKLRISLLVSALVALLGLIGFLSADVFSRLSSLRADAADNRQWVLVQTEVEVLRMQLALARVGSPPDQSQDAIEDFRLWFDVLYSRLTLFYESNLYADYVRADDNARRLAEMRQRMNALIPLVDGPEETLIARLPEISATAEELHHLARDLALTGLQQVAVSADETRKEMARTLIRLAVSASAAFLLLGLFSVILTRLYRLSRRQAEDNLITSERLQMIIANSPDAIVVTNRGGWTVEFNPAAEAMFGLTREEVIGRQVVPRIFHPINLATYQHIISSAIADAVNRGPQRFELDGLRADGSTFPLEISLAIRDLARGALVVGFMRDISDRKAANAALQDALVKARAGEKAKADFLAVMSHEMRTPLNGLIGSMALIQDTPLNDDQRNLLSIMQTTGEVLLGHVNAVLDIARAEAGDIQIADTVFDLDRLIEECIANQSSLAQQNDSSLHHVGLTGPHRTVRGDPKRLRQILLNLIGNAVKFTRNGTITVETERLDPQTVKGRPGMIEFRVIDTGIGIAPEDQERIFDDFETIEAGYARQSSGTGLGLGIVRRLTRAMGGEVGVESEVGEGSVFWLRLPLRPADPKLSDRPPPRAAARPAGRRQLSDRKLDILVIEDNDINRFLMRRMLEEGGHRVIEARDGIEGVEIASRRYFDTILTDISMPRLDGVETTRQIRSNSGPSSRSRIIAITAHALPSEVDEFLAAGMNACLTKPVTREVLMTQIASSSPGPMPVPEREEDVPLLDPSPLQDLHDELGVDMLENLLQRLASEADEKITFIAGSAEADGNMAKAAHQLAGGCATFGARRLRFVLARVEAAVKAGDSEAALNAAASLPNLWTATHDLIKREVRKILG